MGAHEGSPPAAGGAGAGTIEEVIARMSAIEASPPANDGVVYFNRLYLAVTKAVQARVRAMTFEDEAFLARLDVVFANRYFDALAGWEAGSACPEPWRLLFAAHEHRWRRPLQFALCGMNAHINYDLQQALAATLIERDLVPAPDSAQHRDYTLVNSVLAEVEPEVKHWFLDTLVEDVDRATDDEADRFVMWSIADARALAWDHGCELWKLREHPVRRRAYLEEIALVVDVAGRELLL